MLKETCLWNGTYQLDWINQFSHTPFPLPPHENILYESMLITYKKLPEVVGVKIFQCMSNTFNSHTDSDGLDSKSIFSEYEIYW